MGQQQSGPTKRKSTKVSTFGGGLNLDVRNTSAVPSVYKVKSPPIGRGPFGEIREAYHTKLKQKYLMKIIFKQQFTDTELNDIQTEYHLMRELSHPNIMEVAEFFEEPRFFYIILQYFKGRPLFDKVREEGGIQNEFVAAKILRQIAKTLEFIHKKDVVFRNLKLENILYNGRQVVLHDFSLAVKVKSKQQLNELVGPIHFVAPEMIKGSYDQRADIWSFGVVAYVLLYGEYPFDGKDEATIMNKILYDKPDTRSEHPKSQKVIDFIEMILKKKPEERPSWTKIQNHEFFKEAIAKESQSANILFNQVKNNLLSFRIESNVQLGIFLHFLHLYEANVEGYNVAKELFMKIDSKASGKVSLKDFRKFGEENQIGLTERDLSVIYENLDKDKSGTIEYEEFVAGCIDRSKLLVDEKIIPFFSSLAPTHPDFVSIPDLQKKFVSMQKQNLIDFFAVYGLQPDGAFTIDLFIKMMKSLV